MVNREIEISSLHSLSYCLVDKIVELWMNPSIHFGVCFNASPLIPQPISLQDSSDIYGQEKYVLS